MDCITEYFKLLDSQKFREEDLDYSILSRHIDLLTTMAEVSNSCISVYDLYKRNHPFVSNNFEKSLKYSLRRIRTEDSRYFDLHIHPDDFMPLMESGTLALSLCLEHRDRIFDYKLLNEYRIDIDGRWVRVIEQKQALETDIHGNIWLALSVLDISPEQDTFNAVKSQLFNFKTGGIFPMPTLQPDVSRQSVSLTPREKQVLKLVRDGYLSKEISARMAISVNTVNTYRQRILEKLDANNSMEAIRLATRLGLLE